MEETVKNRISLLDPEANKMSLSLESWYLGRLMTTAVPIWGEFPLCQSHVLSFFGLHSKLTKPIEETGSEEGRLPRIPYK